MATYVALLRGVNVGGRTKVAMDDLRACFVASGHQDVRTYIQSGNVVFSSPTARGLAAGIEQRLALDLGLAVKVLVRSARELAAVAAANPFLDGGADPSKLHVTFLARAPEADLVASLAPPSVRRDQLSIAGREVYLHCPDGYGRTKLDNTFFERRLGVAATTRTWNTVTKLVELARE